jgi:kynurenine formamidase
MRCRHLVNGVVTAVVVAFGVGLSAPVTVKGQDTAPQPRNAEEFDEMFRELSNWGRWGDKDQLGTANLITPEKRKEAAGLVQSGITVSLSHNPVAEVAEDNPEGTFEHVMSPSFRTDAYRFRYHGTLLSHIDALCHYQYKDMMYNGVPISASSMDGCSKLGIENGKNGIITRGVLIDLPRLKGVPYLEPGTPVYVEDIEAWEEIAGVRLGSGDAIFLHTGRWIRRAEGGPWKAQGNRAGFHASVGPWLKARDVAVLGSDGAGDVQPSGIDVNNPLHVFLIAGLGMTFLDSMDLTALAETAAELNRWEFMLSVGSIPVTGGTGGPVNPIAVF